VMLEARPSGCRSTGSPKIENATVMLVRSRISKKLPWLQAPPRYSNSRPSLALNALEGVFQQLRPSTASRGHQNRSLKNLGGKQSVSGRNEAAKKRD
ncbi:hypothetical protein, partial [Mesorhizobium sp.]|uniref:hypothetical protein n=1 Tax=Mesorhizobium sp. TaxID=1871066 RepID=UPI00257ABBBF